VVGQWCTPDMMPYELFEMFYKELRTHSNKAVALALAVRRLLVNEQNRFSPRRWAGYYAVGV
jgi:CHAT domain-containing protein